MENMNSRIDRLGANRVQENIPIWYRYTLTIEEAARYYHIGEGKLRNLVEAHPQQEFYVTNGNRVLIKRRKFEEFLDQATAI